MCGPGPADRTVGKEATRHRQTRKETHSEAADGSMPGPLHPMSGRSKSSLMTVLFLSAKSVVSRGAEHHCSRSLPRR